MKIVQRTRQLDETEEELGQDANHSAQSFQVLELLEGDNSNEDQQERDDKQEEPHEQQEPRTVRLKWPKATAYREWQKFDEVLDKLLETTLAGNVDKKTRVMATLIYNVWKDRFGEVDKTLTGNKAEPNRRENKISELRSDLNKLKKKYKKQQNVRNQPCLSCGIFC